MAHPPTAGPDPDSRRRTPFLSHGWRLVCFGGRQPVGQSPPSTPSSDELAPDPAVSGRQCGRPDQHVPWRSARAPANRGGAAEDVGSDGCSPRYIRDNRDPGNPASPIRSGNRADSHRPPTPSRARRRVRRSPPYQAARRRPHARMGRAERPAGKVLSRSCRTSGRGRMTTAGPPRGKRPPQPRRP